jgi:hypothetical protein
MYIFFLLWRVIGLNSETLITNQLYGSESFSRGFPCHHGMARPQVADEGDGLQIWRVAANIFNQQSRTSDRGSFHLGGWAWGLKFPL